MFSLLKIFYFQESNNSVNFEDFICVMDTRDSDLGDDSMVSCVKKKTRSDGKKIFICFKREKRVKFSHNIECGSDKTEVPDSFLMHAAVIY